MERNVSSISYTKQLSRHMGGSSHSFQVLSLRSGVGTADAEAVVRSSNYSGLWILPAVKQSIAILPDRGPKNLSKILASSFRYWTCTDNLLSSYWCPFRYRHAIALSLDYSSRYIKKIWSAHVPFIDTLVVRELLDI